jgi:hypothetical protein
MPDNERPRPSGWRQEADGSPQDAVNAVPFATAGGESGCMADVLYVVTVLGAFVALVESELG